MSAPLAADRSVCTGAGQCVRAAADVFDQGDDGLVVVRRQPAPAEHLDVLAAVDACPSRALSWSA
ncbi:ferredoxin [Kineococcus sp. TBRC 1896]|uniref:Ferredoxin n=1 Tax=Kineococcus mangrovi TaxID=1660183 RepID=A0ABV4I069_9ACTN